MSFALLHCMLNRIAIISTSGSDLDRVRAAIRNPLRYTVREFLSMDAVARELSLFPMDLMVMRYARFDERQVASALAARRCFRDVGLVLMAKDILPEARAKVGGIERLRLLEEPFETSDLTAVIEKLLRGDGAAARLHTRVRREGSLQIVDANGLTYRAQFLDFAQMGARIAIQAMAKFKPRDSVQVIYTSSQAGQVQRLAAKVIWSSVDGGLIEQFMGVKQQTAGLRFIASY